MTIDVIAQTLIAGLLQGGIYSLIAVGLSLAMGVLGIVNFAHGEFLMVAMYISWMTVNWLGIEPYWAVLISFPMLYLFGVLLTKSLILPMIDREMLGQFLLMIGISMVMMNLALIIFSPNFYTVKSTLTSKSISLSGIMITMPRLIAFVVSMSVTGVLFWILNRTSLGRKIRAASQNRRAATLVGINVKKVYQVAFGLSLGCVGIAGPFLAPIYYVSPNIGTFFILYVFAIVIVGGMGNLVGALIASFIIGIADAFGAILMPGSTGPVLPFLILILTLLIKPQGILWKKPS